MKNLQEKEVLEQLIKFPFQKEFQQIELTDRRFFKKSNPHGEAQTLKQREPSQPQ